MLDKILCLYRKNKNKKHLIFLGTAIFMHEIFMLKFVVIELFFPSEGPSQFLMSDITSIRFSALNEIMVSASKKRGMGEKCSLISVGRYLRYTQPVTMIGEGYI